MAKNVIEEIKKKYDLNNDDDVLALYRALQSGEYILDSYEGKQLDDQVYDRAMEIKRKRATDAVNQKTKADTSKKDSLKKDSLKKDSLNNDSLKSDSLKKQNSKKKGSKVIVLTRKEYFFRKFLSLILLLAAISCLGYFSFYCYEAYETKQKQKALASLKDNEVVNAMYDDQYIKRKDRQTGEEIQLQVLDEYKSLFSQNKNLIGWLKIADTNIDYPVMQTADNEFYLNHNIKLQEDKNGTLFLDAACDIIKPSTNYIIYGHNMRSGNMFGSLSKYKNASYYEKHPIIEFDTLYEKGKYQVVFAFMSHIYAEDEIAFKYYQFIDVATKKEFDSNINSMKEMSLYDTGITPEYGSQLITLSTCDYEEADGRFVVVGMRIQ